MEQGWLAYPHASQLVVHSHWNVAPIPSVLSLGVVPLAVHRSVEASSSRDRSSCAAKPHAMAVLAAALCPVGHSISKHSRLQRRRQLKLTTGAGKKILESTVSRIGPPITEVAANDVLSHWRVGAGKLRVACHEADRVTCLSWHEETICVGTQTGRVRTVDVESGSVVGEYCIPKHVPGGTITALFFDGQVVAVGDSHGRVHIWRAELPGSWGFTHSPDWEMHSIHGAGNKKQVNFLTLSPNGKSLVSGNDFGDVTVWEPLGKDKKVEPMDTFHFDENICGLTALPGNNKDLYIALRTGELYTVNLDTGKKRPLLNMGEHLGEKVSLTALAADWTTSVLILGDEKGRLWILQPGNQIPHELEKFHSKEIRNIRFASPTGRAKAPPHLLTTARDGRVCIWDIHEHKPLWALQGLDGDHLVALGDHTRLITNGMVVRDAEPYTVPTRTCHDVEDLTVTACEAILCLDFLKSSD